MGLRRLRRHGGIHGRAVLLLEGDEGAATDREKRPAMVSCAERDERELRTDAEKKTKEGGEGATLIWLVASIASGRSGSPARAPRARARARERDEAGPREPRRWRVGDLDLGGGWAARENEEGGRRRWMAGFLDRGGSRGGRDKKSGGARERVDGTRTLKFRVGLYIAQVNFG